MITIKQARNGFILSDDELGEDYIPESVFPNTIEGAQDLLYTILEDIGYSGSKHDKQRLRIEIIDQHTEKSIES